MFGATDRLLEGLTSKQPLQVAAEMYYDADGMPQWHGARMRPVPSAED